MLLHGARALSQVFLANRTLIRKLVRSSSIGPKDTVLEIGPGTGNITQELVHVAKHVIGVEIDVRLHQQLKSQNYSNLTLYCMDFLHYRLPHYPYKVFANIPFSLQGKITRKLLGASNPPTDCYLVLRKDFAYRLGGIHKEGQLSRHYKQWFNFEITHHFHRNDFAPRTWVRCVLLRIQRNNQ